MTKRFLTVMVAAALIAVPAFAQTTGVPGINDMTINGGGSGGTSPVDAGLMISDSSIAIGITANPGDGVFVAYDPANAEPSRYVFDCEFEVVEDGTEKHREEGDVIGFLGDSSVSPVTDYTTTVHYSAHLTATVIDGRTGEELGRIGTRDAGMRSKSVGFLLFIPVWYIPINTMGDIEDNACDNVARRLSFAQIGGVSTGWPSRYVKTRGSPCRE